MELSDTAVNIILGVVVVLLLVVNFFVRKRKMERRLGIDLSWVLPGGSET